MYKQNVINLFMLLIFSSCTQTYIQRLEDEEVVLSDLGKKVRIIEPRFISECRFVNNVGVITYDSYFSDSRNSAKKIRNAAAQIGADTITDIFVEDRPWTLTNYRYRFKAKAYKCIK